MYDKISDIYLELAEDIFESAELFYDRSIFYRYKHITTNKKLQDKRLLDLLYKYGVYLMQAQKFTIATTTFEQLIDYLEKDNYNNLLIEVYYCLAICNENNDYYQRSVYYYQQVLKLQANTEEGNVVLTSIPNQTEISKKIDSIKKKNSYTLQTEQMAVKAQDFIIADSKNDYGYDNDNVNQEKEQLLIEEEP
mmetsp:Transcript_23741/g.24716  ORF Transcript_23741/g.24716 Transcript_23741/m.24716 type:complete len:193 (-) Transcript_23741:40-618(-)